MDQFQNCSTTMCKDPSEKTKCQVLRAYNEVCVNAGFSALPTGAVCDEDPTEDTVTESGITVTESEITFSKDKLDFSTTEAGGVDNIKGDKPTTKPFPREDTSTQESAALNITTPERTPKVNTLEATTPKATTPKEIATFPKVTSPKATTFKITDPKVATPKVATPKVSDPKATEAKATTPDSTMKSIPEGDTASPESATKRAPEDNTDTREPTVKIIPKDNATSPEPTTKKIPEYETTSQEPVTNRIPKGDTATPEPTTKRIPEDDTATPDSTTKRIPEDDTATHEDKTPEQTLAKPVITEVPSVPPTGQSVIDNETTEKTVKSPTTATTDFGGLDKLSTENLNVVTVDANPYSSPQRAKEFTTDPSVVTAVDNLGKCSKNGTLQMEIWLYCQTNYLGRSANKGCNDVSQGNDFSCMASILASTSCIYVYHLALFHGPCNEFQPSSLHS